MHSNSTVVFVVAVVAVCLGLVAAQCDKRKTGGPLTCCKGRNSSCAVKVPSARAKICFCDEFCEPAGDCCEDFKSVKQECGLLGVQDCVVSPWSSWSPCSRKCGMGMRQRFRQVIVPPSQRGGEPCPPLRQKRGCFHEHCGKESGLAHILPKIFKRLPSQYQGILPAKRLESEIEEQAKDERPSYCALFKIESKHPYCKGTWANTLDPKKPVCVECQASAMNKHGKCKGHGVTGDSTSWVAVDIDSCHGEWIKLGQMAPCKCDNKDFNNFIFV